MNCKHCRFFKELLGMSDRDAFTIGQCRRHAPSHDQMHPFPLAWSDAWCGDYERGIAEGEEPQS